VFCVRADGSSGDFRRAVASVPAWFRARRQRYGNDIEGWQRWLRAYMVLGERDQAQAAADARRPLASDPDKLRRNEDVTKSLRLEG